MSEEMIAQIAAAVEAVAVLAEEGAIPADVADAVVAALEAAAAAEGDAGLKAAEALLEAVAMLMEDGSEEEAMPAEEAAA
jgi:hypothetical protein